MKITANCTNIFMIPYKKSALFLTLYYEPDFAAKLPRTKTALPVDKYRRGAGRCGTGWQNLRPTP